MFRRAASRIAAAGSIAALLTLALFALIARASVARVMTADLDEELDTLAVAISSALEAGELPNESLHSGVELNILAYRLEHHAAVLFDAHRILGATGDMSRHASMSELAQFVRRGEAPFTAPEPFTGHRRLCRFRVTHLAQHSSGQTLVLFRSIEAQQRTLGAINVVLAFLVAAGAATSALILMFAVRGALRPVERITSFAEAVTARDLHRRVQVNGGGEEFRRLGAVINSLLARLEESFDAQRRLVADAAHELKTPATVISAEAQELLRGSLSADEQSESLRVLGSAAAGLAREVDDLLELASGDSSSREPKRFDVDEAVEEAIAFSAAIARERGVEVVQRERAAGEIDGDRVGVIRAISNLISNGVRYGSAQSEITVTARVTDGWCEIEVADRGPGVPEPDRRRIFERFVRLAPARREHPDGSGLGLAIVDQVARAHGGSAEVMSNPGGGALFRLRIPKRR